MLVIKMEVWPHGDSRGAFEVGRAKVWNTGTGTTERADYGAVVEGDWEHANQRVNAEFLAGGFVKDFPRSELGAWALLSMALKDLTLDPR